MSEWDRARDIQARATRLNTDGVPVPSGVPADAAASYRAQKTADAVLRVASTLQAVSSTLVGNPNSVSEPNTTARHRFDRITNDLTKLRADCDTALVSRPNDQEGGGVTLRTLATVLREAETQLALDRNVIDRDFPKNNWPMGRDA